MDGSIRCPLDQLKSGDMWLLDCSGCWEGRVLEGTEPLQQKRLDERGHEKLERFIHGEKERKGKENSS